MQATKDNRLGTENITRLMISLAIPSVLAQIVNVLYNIVDRIYIGRIPGVGAVALTGVGVTFPIITIISAFSSFASGGGAPLASIALGQGNRKRAERILGNAASLLLFFSALLMLFFFVFQKPLLYLFGASDNTIGYSSTYISIYLLGTVFVQLAVGLNTFISCQGHARTAMCSVLIGAVVNIALDPLFIFVFHMGVRGAALATVISQAISTLWVVLFLCGKKTQLHLRKKHLHLEAKVVLPCIALGLAAFIMQSSESIVTVCFNSSLLRYGGDIAVGAMTILTSVMQFAMLPLQGIAQGAQPISSYNYGAKNADRVKKTFRLLLITCLSYSVLLWAAVQLVPRVFVSIFTADTSLIEFTAPMLKIYLGGLFLFGIQIACQMTFTSLGKAVNSIIVAVVRKFVLLIPLIYIMPHMISDSTTGVYMAEPIADITAVIFASVLFTFQFKKALAEIQN